MRIIIANHEKFHAEIYHFVEQCEKSQGAFDCRRLRLKPEELALLRGDAMEVAAALEAAHKIKADRGLKPEDIFVVFVEGNLSDDEDDEYFSISGLMDRPDGPGGGVAVISLYYMQAGSTFMREGAHWWNSLSASEKKRILSDSILNLLLSAIASEAASLLCHGDSRACVMDYCQTPTDLVASLKGGFEFCKVECLPFLQARPEGQAILAIAARLAKQPFRTYKLTDDEFDVFLCHASPDKSAVREIGQRLKERGIRPWLDEEQLRPGLSWQRSLQEQIEKIRSAAVFVGGSGYGPWQELEIESFLGKFVQRRCPVIPVFLSGVTGTPELPIFLSNMAWVDFRQPEPDPLDRLIWGITGEKPLRASSGP